MKNGDMIDVMPHTLGGWEWTVNKVGIVMGPMHQSMIQWGSRSLVMPYWWLVQLESDTAKGGWALAALPEKYLGPHACTSNCPDHFGIKRSESCAI